MGFLVWCYLTHHERPLTLRLAADIAGAALQAVCVGVEQGRLSHPQLAALGAAFLPRVAPAVADPLLVGASEQSHGDLTRAPSGCCASGLARGKARRPRRGY